MPECRLWFVVARPRAARNDFPLIYQNYFTHQARSAAGPGAGRSVIHWLYRALLSTTGVARQRADLLSFYLRGTQPGRLLDVGCGDGGQLPGFKAWVGRSREGS